MSKRFSKSQDEFQHKRGQKDGSRGALPGTTGDSSSKKYGEGYRGGQFNYEKEKYGEPYARTLKAERDFVRKISKGGKPKEKESSTRREAPLYSCPICGDEYNGYYCLNCGYDDDEGYDDYPSQEESVSEEVEEELTETEKRHRQIEEEVRALVGSRGRLYVTKYMSDERLKEILKNDLWLYTGVTFVPPDYLLRYRCDRCGHEWDDIYKGFGSPREIQDCMMGCSKGAGEPSLLGLFKTIKGLITGKEPFGYGRLIKSKEL